MKGSLIVDIDIRIFKVLFEYFNLNIEYKNENSKQNYTCMYECMWIKLLTYL